MLRRIQMLTFVLGLTVVAGADTLRVPSEYPTIQAAMAATVTGDTVLVADGTYTGPGNTNTWFNMRAITVRSENGAASCIIDCERAGSAFLFSGEPPESVVDGFTITNGLSFEGGGIYMYYNSNPTILNCVITGNTANGGEGGGGIYCALANPTITNCTITGNTSTGFGGGRGRGVYCVMSNPTIRNSVIAGNTTDGSGGGLFSAEGSNPTIINSIVWGNGPDEISVDVFSIVTVSHSDVHGGCDAAGNIDALIEYNKDNVDQSLKDIQYTVSAVSATVDSIVHNLEGTTRNMNEFSRMIRQNPGLLLDGTPRQAVSPARATLKKEDIKG